MWQRCARQVNAELGACVITMKFLALLCRASVVPPVFQNKVRALMDDGPLAKKSNNRHFI